MTSPNIGMGALAAPSASESAHLEEMLKQLILDNDVVLPWEPAFIQVVRNPQLEKIYQDCCSEFQGKFSPAECQEKFGLLVHPTATTINAYVNNGLMTRESNYNALGYNSEGVYVCQYTDVSLNFIQDRMPDCQCVRLVLCSFMMGKSTKAIPRMGPGAGVYQSGYIHPTPGFNSHLPLLPLNPDLSVVDKFDRSQVYLYELVNNSAVKFPRHILPLAVVHYTIGGQMLPNIELSGQASSRPLATGEATLPTQPMDNSPIIKFFAELKKTCLAKEWTLPWKPVNMVPTIDQLLRTEYEMKQRGLRLHGCTPEQIRDRWGFFLPESAQDLVLSSTAGLRVNPHGMVNALGFNSMGVYLTRHLDVALEHSNQEMKLGLGSNMGVIKLLVCKYFIGNCTKAFPRAPECDQFIDPSPGFDSHISIYPARPEEEDQPRYDKSQIYLFEADAIGGWSLRPRQVMPYAIITFCPDEEAGRQATVKPLMGGAVEESVRPLMSGQQRVVSALYGADDLDYGAIDEPAEDMNDFYAGLRPNVAGGESLLGVRPLLEPVRRPSGYPTSNGQTQAAAPQPRANHNSHIEGNPQLQHIIDKINARGPTNSTSSPLPLTTANSSSSPSGSGASAYPGLAEVVQGINSRWAGGYGGSTETSSYNNPPW